MDGFRTFLLRGNVVDLAVGIVIGSAFAAVVTAFTAAFLTPLIGLVAGVAGDFSQASASVGTGADAVDFPYGLLVEATISFVVVAAVVYVLVVKPVNSLMDRYSTEPDVSTPTRPCDECLSDIPEAASRCAFCGVRQSAGPTAGSTPGGA